MNKVFELGQSRKAFAASLHTNIFYLLLAIQAITLLLAIGVVMNWPGKDLTWTFLFGTVKITSTVYVLWLPIWIYYRTREKQEDKVLFGKPLVTEKELIRLLLK